MQFENGVNLIKLSKDRYCLNHALRQKQIFGEKILKETYDCILEGNSIEDTELEKVLIANKFLTHEPPDLFLKDLIEEQSKLKEKEPKFNLLRILLTDICNLNCDYCKVVKLIEKPKASPISVHPAII